MQLEDGDIPIRIAPINVRSHLEDAMMATSVAAYNKGVELGMYVDMDNVIYSSDALRLRQLMLNVSGWLYLSWHAGAGGSVRARCFVFSVLLD